MKRVVIRDKAAIQSITNNVSKRSVIEKFEKNNKTIHVKRDTDISSNSNIKTITITNFNNFDQFDTLFKDEIQKSNMNQHKLIEEISKILDGYMNSKQHDNTHDIKTIDLINFIKEQEITPTTRIVIFLYQELERKRKGYKLQDIKKQETRNLSFYSKEQMISIYDIITLLKTSNLKCYYCSTTVYLYYTNPRNSKQWTLDRIDNTKGHWSSNCVISCLSCNISRGTMDEKKFLYGKKLTITKV